MDKYNEIKAQDPLKTHQKQPVSCYIALVTPSSPYKTKKNFSINHLKKHDLTKKLGKHQKRFINEILKQEIIIETAPKTPDLINRILDKQWLIPGVGKKMKNCNEWLPTSFCPTCGKPHLIHGTCNSPQCPNCAIRHRYRRTEKAFLRLFSYKIDHKKRLQHCIVSITEKQAKRLTTLKEIKKLNHRIYEFLKNKKLEGGWVIFHPYRIISEKKRELYDFYKTYMDNTMGEFALWKALTKIKNWKDFVYFSPHYHIIGSTNKTHQADKDDPYIFKRVGDLYKPEDLYACMMYLLSHIGIHKNHKIHNIHWFGEISNSKWSIEKAKEKTQQYAHYKLNQMHKDFSNREGTTDNKHCIQCETKLIPMDLLPDHINSFNNQTKTNLINCYKWFKGQKPPPITQELFEILK